MQLTCMQYPTWVRESHQHIAAFFSLSLSLFGKNRFSPYSEKTTSRVSLTFINKQNKKSHWERFAFTCEKTHYYYFDFNIFLFAFSAANERHLFAIKKKHGVIKLDKRQMHVAQLTGLPLTCSFG
jgi:hypothetical protein